MSAHELESWFLGDFAQKWLARDSGLQRLQARFRLDEVPQQAMPAMPNTDRAPPSCRAISPSKHGTKLSTRSRPASATSLASAWEEMVESASALQVETFHPWPPRPVEAHERHARTFLAYLTWRPLRADETRRHRKEHEDVARAVHKGSARYERNWTERVLSPAPMQIDGITDMSFRTEEDFLERFWTSPEGYPYAEHRSLDCARSVLVG